MHKVADKFVYLCMIGPVPDARKHLFNAFDACMTVVHHQKYFNALTKMGIVSTMTKKVRVTGKALTPTCSSGSYAVLTESERRPRR